MGELKFGARIKIVVIWYVHDTHSQSVHFASIYSFLNNFDFLTIIRFTRFFFTLFFPVFCKIRGRPGDAFVFPGSLLHRGRGNDGNSHRFFYYASFSSEIDKNSD